MSSHGLSRRQLLKHSVLGAGAIAVGSHFRVGPSWAGTTGNGSELDELGSVEGLTVHGPDLAAVGDRDHSPAAWIRRDGQWRQSADASAFPAGTHLADVVSFAGQLVAVGAVVETTAGATVTDEDGIPVTLEDVWYRPVVLTSVDGQRWQAFEPLPHGEYGGLFSIAVVGSRLIAIGARYDLPGPAEGQGALVLESGDGETWSPIATDGLGTIGEGHLAGLTSWDGGLVAVALSVGPPVIYRSDDGSRWESLPAPAVPAQSRLAAVASAGSDLVVGVLDEHERASLWLRRGSAGWSPMRVPDRLAGDHVHILGATNVDGAVVLTGSSGGRTAVATAQGE